MEAHVDDLVRGERAFLRFGRSAVGNRSRNWRAGRAEAGLSCYRGHRLADGAGYRLDISDDALPIQLALRQISSVVNLVLDARPVYVVAGGEEVGVGTDGEPLIGGDGLSLKLIPPHVPVRLPEWVLSVVPEAGEFERAWVRWRRIHGGLLANKPPGTVTAGAALEGLGMKFLIEFACAVYGQRPRDRAALKRQLLKERRDRPRIYL